MIANLYRADEKTCCAPEYRREGSDLGQVCKTQETKALQRTIDLQESLNDESLRFSEEPRRKAEHCMGHSSPLTNLELMA